MWDAFVVPTDFSQFARRASRYLTQSNSGFKTAGRLWGGEKLTISKEILQR